MEVTQRNQEIDLNQLYEWSPTIDLVLTFSEIVCHPKSEGLEIYNWWYKKRYEWVHTFVTIKLERIDIIFNGEMPTIFLNILFFFHSLPKASTLSFTMYIPIKIPKNDQLSIFSSLKYVGTTYKSFIQVLVVFAKKKAQNFTRAQMGLGSLPPDLDRTGAKWKKVIQRIVRKRKYTASSPMVFYRRVSLWTVSICDEHVTRIDSWTR